jgi:hypothetical protein
MCVCTYIYIYIYIYIHVSVYICLPEKEGKMAERVSIVVTL